MNEIYIKYISDDALATLKANPGTITEKLIENPEDSSWIEEIITEKVFIEKKYKIKDFIFEIPNDKNDKLTDIKNGIILYESLKHLPRYVLSDERFWLWINFKKGYNYALKTMPVSTGKSIFKNHWLFSGGNRRGIFFGVLSRLFFRVEMTIDESLGDKYELTKFALTKSVRLREMTWRNYSNDKKIVIGVLKAEMKFLSEYKNMDKSKYYGEIAKYVSQLGSVMLLDIMSEEDIYELVYNKFKELMDNKLIEL